MSLFLDAAKRWESLLNISYTFIIGHKKNTETIRLFFRRIDFDHLSGIHKANDIDFKLSRKVYRGEKLINALLSGKLDDKLIEKSIYWNQISDRLIDINRLERILDSDFRIYQFNPRKLNFHSDIRANYLIFSEQYQTGIFLFIDKDQDTDYCKSIFSKDDRDYTINQTKWTVLKKIKRHEDTEEVLFLNESYREQESQEEIAESFDST